MERIGTSNRTCARLVAISWVLLGACSSPRRASATPSSDTFILLLDFNSLYPSIIQEYNLCHTTMNWSAHHAKMMEQKAAAGVRSNINSEEDDEDADDEVQEVGNDLPPIPDESLSTGVLPRVIRTIIQRRGVVKKMLKERGLTNEKKKE